MKNVNPYLNFQGNAEEAFNFYKSIFGGEFSTLMRFKDTPEGEKCSPEDANKIMHIALPLGTGQTLMATDAVESMGHKTTIGNNFYISVNADNEEEGQRIFDGLSAGGKVQVPFQKQFWGAWHGNFIDKFGVPWMVNL